MCGLSVSSHDILPSGVREVSYEHLPKMVRYDSSPEFRLSINNRLIPIRLSINEKIRK